MPDPTPKLPMKEWLNRESFEIHGFATTVYLSDALIAIGFARSDAFEKAERLAREEIDEGMSEGWNDACREIAASIARALAKEQTK